MLLFRTLHTIATGIDMFAFTKACRNKPRSFYSLFHQIFEGRLGPTFRQQLVIGIASATVGVRSDCQLHLWVFVEYYEDFCKLYFRIRADIGFVEVEMNDWNVQ